MTAGIDDLLALKARIAELEDREAIRELDARYCRYLDEARSGQTLRLPPWTTTSSSVAADEQTWLSPYG